MNRCCFLSLFFCCFILFPYSLGAKDCLILITSTSQIQSDRDYVLVSQDPKSKKYYILSNNVYGNKLRAIKLDAFSKTLYLESVNKWHFLKKNDSFQLKSVDSDEMICLSEKSTTSLLLQQGNAASFYLESQQDGSFYFEDYSVKDGEKKERYLSLNYDTQMNYYFGNFVMFPYSHPNIYVFRVENGFVDVQGSTFLPEDGERVVLHIPSNDMTIASDSISSSGHLVTLNVPDHLLSDSTIAPTRLKGIYKVSLIDNNCFLLEGIKGFLFVDNTSSQQGKFSITLTKDLASSFFIQNGCICCGKDDPYFLASTGPGSNEVVCLSLLLKKNEDFLPINFLKVAKDPAVRLTSDGHYVFEGGWTCNDFLSQDYSSFKVIDFTKLTLPSKQMEDVPSTLPLNVLTIINESELRLLPEEWPNVISCSAKLYHAATIIKLKDNVPFFIPVDFRVGKDSIEYVRSAFLDNSFETCVLPFTIVDLPANFIAYELRSCSNDSLFWVQSDTLEANESFLLHPTLNDDNVMSSITFKGISQIVKATSRVNSSNIFQGVLDTLYIRTGSQPLFFLSPDGKQFVRPLSGSKLLPFHSYLKDFEM